MTTRMERIRLRLADATAPADGLTGSASLDALEWVSRWITLAAYVAAVIVFVAHHFRRRSHRRRIPA